MAVRVIYVETSGRCGPTHAYAFFRVRIIHPMIKQSWHPKPPSIHTSALQYNQNAMPEETELSEREREILRLVATGASNKEIASQLVISPNTVKVHLRNIFAKVGVASRTEATLYALRTGLLASPAPPRPIELQPEPQSIAAPESSAPPVDALIPLQAAAGIRPRARRAGELLLMVALLVLTSLATWAALRVPDQANLAAPAAPAAPVATTAPPNRWSALPPPPEPLTSGCGAVYENSLFVLAGDTGGKPASSAWRYELLTERWTPAAPKPTPVSRGAAALLGEKIYVAGGRAADGQPTAALEVYDPRADRWEQRAALPSALEGHALAALEGRLYLFGGWDGTLPRAEVYSYDPDLDRWDARAPLPAPRAYAAAAVLEGKIILAGGQNGQTLLDQVLLYFPNRDQPGGQPWEEVTPLPAPSTHMAAASLAGIVYFLGGESSSGQPPFEWLAQSGQWASFDPPPADPGAQPLMLAFNTHLYVLNGAQHQAYQAIYNLSFPVIR